LTQFVRLISVFVVFKAVGIIFLGPRPFDPKMEFPNPAARLALRLHHPWKLAAFSRRCLERGIAVVVVSTSNIFKLVKAAKTQILPAFLGQNHGTPILGVQNSNLRILDFMRVCALNFILVVIISVLLEKNIRNV